MYYPVYLVHYSRIIKFITDHSEVAPEKIRELMMRPDEMATDVGSIVDGNEAVRLGIIDRVGGLSDALEELRGLIKNNS